MITNPKSAAVPSLSVRRGRRRPCAGPAPAALRSRRSARGRRLARNQRLGRDPARRYRGDPHGPLGNGPGTITGLAQLVAEELECNWSKIVYEYPTPGESVKRKRAWGDFSTGGSRGIRTSHDYVRKGGAAARLMLVQAAANQWNVPVSECSTANSVITHGPSKRKVSYGKVAEAAARLEAPKDVPLKDPKNWKVIGKRSSASTRATR
jgi:CO/xanthine dehydrogenase Mo-binding subunit